MVCDKEKLVEDLTHLHRKFFTFFSGEHHLVEERLHRKYGPVIRTGPESLAFSSLPAFNSIYGFNKCFEKGDFYNFGRDAGTQAGSIFTARTDALHREHKRKVVGSALSTGQIKTYEPIISKNVSILLSRLTEARQSCQNTSSVNVAAIIHRYTFDTIVEIIYGNSLCSGPYTDTRAAHGLLAGFRALSKMAWGGSLLPYLGWLMSTRPMVFLTRRPTYDTQGNMTSIAALAERIRDLVFVHLDNALHSDQPSILQSFLHVPDSDSKRMKPQEIWRECFNLIFAGPGSTAAALTAIVYELGKPHGHEWQERCCAATSPTTSSLVLTAVIKETLRLHAPFPTAFPRTITPGAEAAIPDLPAPLPVGTVVSSNTYVLGHSKNIWGEDAELWRPQRWLGITESKEKDLDDAFVVFSKGPRGCIGKEIAIRMLSQAVVSILMRWKIEATGDLRRGSFLEMQYEECGIVFIEK